jgi:hypothetical protein
MAALQPFDRVVLQYLDGTRERPALIEALAGRLATGTITAPPDLALGLAKALDASLERIARGGLLIATETP